MQYDRSYLSGYFDSGYPTLDATGGLLPPFRTGVFCGFGRGYNMLLKEETPSIDQYLSYNKVLMKDLMLRHEAIFKYQVYELHRLYWRQRELMDPIQMRELSMKCFGSQIQCDVSQKVLQIPYCLSLDSRDDKPSGKRLENYEKPSSFFTGKNTQAVSVLYPAENNLKKLEVSSSRSSKCRKGMLDLELPSELFTQTDEGESLEEKRAVEIHPPLHAPSVSISNCSQKSNVMLGEGASSQTSYFFDLNEPIQSDKMTTSTNFTYSSTNSTEIVQKDQDLSGNSTSKSSVVHEIAYNMLEEGGSAGSSLTSPLEASFSGKLHISCNDSASLGFDFARKEQEIFYSNKRGMFSTSSTTSSPLVPLSNDASSMGPNGAAIVIQALPCFSTREFSNRTSGSSTGHTGIKRKYISSNLNVACSQSLRSRTYHMSCDTGSQPTRERYSVERFVKDSHRTKPVVDLDLNVVPSSSLLETEACQEKVKFKVGVVNLDLNILPSNSLPETEVSLEKVEIIDGINGLGDSEGQLDEIRDKLDYDGNGVFSSISSEPCVPSSQFSSSTSFSSSGTECIQNDKETDIPAILVPCNSSDESEKCAKDDACVDIESGNRICVSETCDDLPFTLGKKIESLVAVGADRVETGLEAPVSPDNKEHSPTREDSEDNHIEKLEDSNKDIERIAAEAIASFSLSSDQQCVKSRIRKPLGASVDCLNWFAGVVSPLAGNHSENSEDNHSEKLEDPNKDIERIAAEAIASFSLSSDEQCVKSRIRNPLEASVDCLNWFAGVVSSLAGNLENEFEDDLSDAPDDTSYELAFDSLNNFKTVTFKFTGTKVEDASCKSIDDKIKNATSLHRRAQARNVVEVSEIQSEVAAAASPSSYDLTENIRPAAAPRTVKGNRPAGKPGRRRGKRHHKRSFLNLLVGKRMCSLLQQHACGESEQSFLQSYSFQWGRNKRRQKHQRARWK